MADQNSEIQKAGNKMLPIAVAGVIVLILLVGGVIFLQNRNVTSDTQTINNTQTEENTTSIGNETPQNEEVKTFNLEAGSFYYKPNSIKVNKGDTVRIVMNAVDMMHDFKITELGVSIPITKSGETSEVQFTADQAGEFEFYCSVGQHRQNGQVGTLIVEE